MIMELDMTAEETKAVEELLAKMREEKRREETIRQYKLRISNVVGITAESIGVMETKNIIRDIYNALLECNRKGVQFGL